MQIIQLFFTQYEDSKVYIEWILSFIEYLLIYLENI